MLKKVSKNIHFSEEINPILHRNQYTRSYVYEGATAINYHAE